MKICEQELLLLSILDQTSNFAEKTYALDAVLRKWKECLGTFRPGNELPPIGVVIELVDVNFNYAKELEHPETIPLDLEYSIISKENRYIRKEMANSYSPKTLDLVHVDSGKTVTIDTSMFKWRVA